MIRPLRPLMLLVLGALALAACKKDADVPAGADTAVSITPTPPNTAAATATSAPAAVTVSAAPTTPPPPPPVAAAPVQQASIDGCCSALAAVSKSGRGKDAKAKSAAAAKLCSGIAKLVKDGKTSRASALTQIKSSLIGVDVPSECH